jgi:rod shape-determining protein MreD
MSRGTRFISIYFSLLLSLILMILPIPLQWQWLRPEWLTLMLIYWVLREPDKLGVLTGFSFGLMMDILGEVLLGQYALTMTIVVYLTHRFRNRMRFFLFWQELFVILILIGMGQLILITIEWLIGHPPRTLLYWSSTVLSVMLWPLLNRVLQFKKLGFIRS